MKKQLKIGFSNDPASDYDGLDFVSWLVRASEETADFADIFELYHKEAGNAARTWNESAALMAEKYPRMYARWRGEKRLGVK